MVREAAADVGAQLVVPPRVRVRVRDRVRVRVRDRVRAAGSGPCARRQG